MRKKEIVAKIMACDNFYHAVGYLTAGAALGIMTQLWMMYYGFRMKANMPISEVLQLQELKLRVISVQNVVVDTTFWEVNRLDNGWALNVTYANNAVWNETCKTFTADDVHQATDFCIVVLGISAKELYVVDRPEINVPEDPNTFILL